MTTTDNRQSAAVDQASDMAWLLASSKAKRELTGQVGVGMFVSGVNVWTVH